MAGGHVLATPSAATTNGLNDGAEDLRLPSRKRGIEVVERLHG